MLDTDTKRRIDNCRDILVGKVPDPKSQVEQITIALIYKFMDDMDAEAEELGGKRKFFAGSYEKYGWSKLMASNMGGIDILMLYSEAIQKMNENPGIPALFRDIFKNAYLPYRDPETLRSFLKEINTFSYDHSEKLGDAFEYLLSVLGSQGDAGQFRTPRHIIEFIVDIIDPKKNETILDPACGTAGFLISAYKHILDANKKERPGDKLTPDERKRLAANIHGYDISPDMVRLSLVNLYLHGFANPRIEEYDTLTSEDKWNEYADIILANPPFMSPKGGIKPHKRFSVQASRSEVLFVDYISEHLTPTGRAGIIVPEGIIFQSGTAYKQLREMLVKNSLIAVISLPAGVFNPYSGVKTSILILDKRLAKKSDSILFAKIENDGFGLGAQRRAIQKNDLTETITILKDWANHETSAYDELRRDRPERKNILVVPKEKLAANGDYNLSGERYRSVIKTTNRDCPLIELGRICTKVTDGSHFSPETTDSGFPYVTVKDLNQGRIDFKNCKKINHIDYIELVKNGCNPKRNDILFSKDGTVGKTALINFDQDFVVLSSLAIITPDSNIVIPEYLYCLLSSEKFISAAIDHKTGVAIRRIVLKTLKTIQIPLPPLEIQKEIVAEIEGYRKVIDGARTVIDNYCPHISIHPDWPMVELGAISTIVRGSSPRPQGNPKYFGGSVPRLMVADITRDGMYTTPRIDSLTEVGATKSRPMKKGEVIITVSGNPGLPTILVIDACIHDGFVGLRELSKDVLPEYLYFALLALHANHGSQSVGAVFRNLTTDQIRNFKIALPPLATQQAIVTEIEAEQALVAANRELITRFEKKIQTTINHIWGETPRGD